MAIKIRCPNCGASISVPESYHGKSIKCPKCDCTFTALTQQERQIEEHEVVKKEIDARLQRKRSKEVVSAFAFLSVGAIAVVVVVVIIALLVSASSRSIETERKKKAEQERLGELRQGQEAERRAREPEKKAREAKGVGIAARDLWREISPAYENNPINAERLYKGRTVIVYGTISDISRGFLGGPRIKLDVGGGVFSSISCEFSTEDEDDLCELEKGCVVVIQGVLSDYMLGTVFLKNCRLRTGR
jgi:predicted Zn finger-like uncharacterized protein